jgi:hopanoid biosynthesis associated protein HpnK
VKQVAFTADDFGVSPRVNAAVVRAAREGVLTGASWMAGGAAAADALARARELPHLAVGVHLTLVVGDAVLPPAEIAGLVDRGGRFPASPAWQGVRCAFSAATRAALRRELRAQIEHCLAGGRPPSHLDGHLDFHVHPTIFPVLVALAREYRIPAVRVPRDPIAPALAFDRRHAGRKLAEAAIFTLLCRRAATLARAAGLRIADRVYGHHQTGAVDERYLLHVIAGLPAGVSEVYCHPGAAVADDPELAALMSPRVRHALDAAGACRRHYDS